MNNLVLYGLESIRFSITGELVFDSWMLPVALAVNLSLIYSVLDV